MADFLEEGFPLKNFKREPPVQIFQDAIEVPEFFQNQLLNPNRVIKILEDDPNANERVFYYQYLKLCQDLEGDEKRLIVQNMKDLIFNPDFYFIFPSDSENPFTDSQFKRLAFEFMELMSLDSVSVDLSIATYPIIDIVFSYMMRSLLLFNGKATSSDEYISKEESLGCLCSIFDLSMQSFGNCIKFVESDVFAYEEVPNKVYMVYIADDTDKFPAKEDSQIESAYESSSLSQPPVIEASTKKNQIYQSKTSGVYQFADFTSSPQEMAYGYGYGISQKINEKKDDEELDNNDFSLYKPAAGSNENLKENSKQDPEEAPEYDVGDDDKLHSAFNKDKNEDNYHNEMDFEVNHKVESPQWPISTDKPASREQQKYLAPKKQFEDYSFKKLSHVGSSSTNQITTPRRSDEMLHEERFTALVSKAESDYNYMMSKKVERQPTERESAFERETDYNKKTKSSRQQQEKQPYKFDYFDKKPEKNEYSYHPKSYEPEKYTYLSQNPKGYQPDTLKGYQPDSLKGYQPEKYSNYQTQKYSSDFDTQFISKNTNYNDKFKSTYFDEITKPSPMQYSGVTPISTKLTTNYSPMFGGKLKLNVTEDFTDSILLEKLPEQFRRSIKLSKDRARAYRKSIQHVL